MIESLASIAAESMAEQTAVEVFNSSIETGATFKESSSLSAFEQREEQKLNFEESNSKYTLEQTDQQEKYSPETQVLETQYSEQPAKIFDENSPFSAFEQREKAKQTKEFLLQNTDNQIIENNSYRSNESGKVEIKDETVSVAREDLTTHSASLSNYVDQLGERMDPGHFMKDLEFGVDSDGKVIVRGTEEYNRNSMIKVDGDKASAKAGSLEGAGSLNEFINETKLMPDTTYNIDDRQVCRTDQLGRVVSSKAELHKPIEGTRYQQRDTHTQARIIKDKDGILGHDDAGHLVPNRLGGPNEAINQIPMARELNRSGSLWFKTENELSNAVKDGKEVIVSDTLEYTGDSFRPDRINRTIIIDGSERVITFDNLPK